jgi:hypothetical protein
MLVALSKKRTCVLSPPVSLLSPTWQGWCMSSMQSIKNRSANRRSSTVSLLSLITIRNSLIMSTTQPLLGSSADHLASYLGWSSGTSTYCQGAVLGNRPRFWSAHSEASASDSPDYSSSVTAAFALGRHVFAGEAGDDEMADGGPRSGRG